MLSSLQQNCQVAEYYYSPLLWLGAGTETLASGCLLQRGDVNRGSSDSQLGLLATRLPQLLSAGFSCATVHVALEGPSKPVFWEFVGLPQKLEAAYTEASVSCVWLSELKRTFESYHEMLKSYSCTQ